MLEGFKRRLFSNISIHNESLMRDFMLALSVPYNSGISMTKFLKITKLEKLNIQNTIIISNTLKKVGLFLGDGLNNYLGDFSPDEILKKEIHLGIAPSDVIMEALQSQKKEYNCGVIYPESFQILENNKIITQHNLISFLNLFAKLTQDEALKAITLNNETNTDARYKIRKEMVELNCNGVASLYCAFSHIFKPNQALINLDIIDMDKLNELYPEEIKRAKLIQLSYHNIACLNRIVREGFEKRIEPDAIITILERDGNYNCDIKKSVCEISQKNLNRKTIPIKELPSEMQKAIFENQDFIKQGIEDLRGDSRKFIYNLLSNINIHGGVSNHVARVMAKKEGKLIQNAPSRNY